MVFLGLEIITEKGFFLLDCDLPFFYNPTAKNKLLLIYGQLLIWKRRWKK